MTGRIYLDYNATTPLAPEVKAAMLPHFDEAYGNPSSLHWAGVSARNGVEAARSQVAALLCCDATEVVFTSGGTEANNSVIKGVFFSRLVFGKPCHVITSQIEHPAVLEPCRFIERLGAQVTRLPVDGTGRVDPADVANAIRSDTALISIMHANNEVGTIQHIAEIAQIAREHGVLCHTDAAQSVGKIPADVESLGVDLLSVAGHKLYGPKGVGALFVREGISLEPLLHGAGHEAGRRAGTENILELVGLGAACELAQDWMESDRSRRETPTGPRQLADRPGQPAYRAGDGQSFVAAALWERDRGNAGRFWFQWRTPFASRAIGLAGDGVPKAELVDQGNAPPDYAQQHLSASVPAQ